MKTLTLQEKIDGMEGAIEILKTERQDWHKNPDHVLSKMLNATEKDGLMQAQ